MTVSSEEIETAYARYDLLVVFCCQALPILPELICVLAGISRTRPHRFRFGHAVGVTVALPLLWTFTLRRNR